MANRVTGTEVKEIINTSLSAAEVEPFIPGANAVVTGKCAANGSYSATELKEIERWLASHFVSVRDPSRSAVKSQSAGKVSITYSLISGRAGLAATPYGQQVLFLDYQNTLASLGTSRVDAKVRAFGTQHEDFEEE